MKYNFNKLKEIVKSKMSLKRFTHTLGVVEMSEKLAKIYNANIEKCKVAALLHDICKEMNMEYIKNICKNNFIERSKARFYIIKLPVLRRKRACFAR